MKISSKKKEAEPCFGAVNFERRNNPRFSVNCPLEYWPIRNSTRRSARTADIGEGGLMFYLPDEVEIGQNLKVRLYIGDLLQLEPVEALVQVVWRGFIYEQGSGYPVGVKFTDISADNLGKLKMFLKTLANFEKPADLGVPSRLLSDLGISALGNLSTGQKDPR